MDRAAPCSVGSALPTRAAPSGIAARHQPRELLQIALTRAGVDERASFELALSTVVMK